MAEKVKVYKSETVVSVTEIEAQTDEQALKYARVSEGMPNSPEYKEVERRGVRFSLSPDIGTRQPKDKKDAK